jgi:hypothetical protein
MSNVYSFPTPSRLQKVATEAEVKVNLNPHQKPMRLIIGTAAVACMLLNRICTSIENEQIQFTLWPSRVNLAYNHFRSNINDANGRTAIHRKGVDPSGTAIDVEI